VRSTKHKRERSDWLGLYLATVHERLLSVCPCTLRLASLALLIVCQRQAQAHACARTTLSAEPLCGILLILEIVNFDAHPGT